MILPVHGTRVSVLPLINFSFLKITIFWKKTVFWSESETRISRFMAVSILWMVQLSAPLGWPLMNNSPSQEGSEAHRRTGLRRSPVIRVDHSSDCHKVFSCCFIALTTVAPS